MQIMDEVNEVLEGISFSSDQKEFTTWLTKLYKMDLKDKLPDEVKKRLVKALGNVLLMYLDDPEYPARFRNWLMIYFGQKPASFHNPAQQPKFIYYPGLSDKWWFEPREAIGEPANKENLSLVREELANFISKNEAQIQAYVDEMMPGQEWNDLKGKKKWGALPLLTQNNDSQWLEKLPQTQDFLSQVPLANCPPHSPEVFLSVLEPSVELPEHYGLSNFKLTTHLPVFLPNSENVNITVNGETRRWSLDELLIFDDSFLHSAKNKSEERRVVLIFDIWHPDLSKEERDCLTETIATIDRANGLMATWF